MSSVDFFAQDKIWFEKPRYDEAERRFYEKQTGPSEETQVPTVLSSPSVVVHYLVFGGKGFGGRPGSGVILFFSVGYFRN